MRGSWWKTFDPEIPRRAEQYIDHFVRQLQEDIRVYLQKDDVFGAFAAFRSAFSVMEEADLHEEELQEEVSRQHYLARPQGKPVISGQFIPGGRLLPEKFIKESQRGSSSFPDGFWLHRKPQLFYYSKLLSVIQEENSVKMQNLRWLYGLPPSKARKKARLPLHRERKKGKIRKNRRYI